MLWERTSTQKKKSTKLTTDQESKLKRRKNWGTEEAEIAAFVNDEIKKGYIQVKDNFFYGRGGCWTDDNCVIIRRNRMNLLSIFLKNKELQFHFELIQFGENEASY